MTPALRPAAATEPALHPFGPAVLVVAHAAAGASGLPASLRHVRLIRYPLRLRPHSQAHGLPYRIVAVSRSHERVGDFVQQRVANQIEIVPLDEVER